MAMNGQVGAMEQSVAQKMGGGSKNRTAPHRQHGNQPRLGSGRRFARLKAKLASQPGVTDPGALAASIGRAKYGNAKMAQMAAKGRQG